jgi:type IV pilus assembly protein PilO
MNDRFQLLSLSQRVLAGVVPLIVVALLLGYFLLTPLWQKKGNLLNEIAQEKIRLEQIRRAQAQLERFKLELAEIEMRFKQVLAMLPEAREIPNLLKNVAELARQQNLEFLLFKPDKEIPKDFVAEIPILVQLKGPYHQIALFFDQIRRLPRIVNAQQLDLGSYDEKTASVSARCQLVTYRFLSTPIPPPKAEKKK